MTTPYQPAQRNIPSHLSEKSFRVYEPYLKKAVDAFPDETEVPSVQFVNAEGKPLSGNTFAARWRDSILSLTNFGWTTNVDVAKLASITGHYAIVLDPARGSCWFKPRARRGRPLLYTAEMRERAAAEPSHVNRAAWEDWDDAELTGLCIMIHRKRISGTFTLKGPVPSDRVEYLESNFNVSLIFDEERQQTTVT